VQDDEVDILLISPERLANAKFVDKILSVIGPRISLLVVDEAHCISDWGHDFRPHYRLLGRLSQRLPANFRLLATTATANRRVIQDLQTVLGPQLEVFRGELNRPSLTLQTIRLGSRAARLAWLAQVVQLLPGSGIIYTLTIRDAEQVCLWLKAQGLNVQSYTGQSEGREQLEEALLNNEVKALVATTALGMGYDKPDLAFVIHYQTPGSVVAYYQQVGRAGRALACARGILLGGQEDSEINDYFIDAAFPTRQEVEEVLLALDSAEDGISILDLQTVVNVSKSRLEKTVTLLSLESPAPLAKLGTKWRLTTHSLGESFWERVQRLTALRKFEQEQMQEYMGLQCGHMKFLVEALDGDPAQIEPPRLAPILAVIAPERLAEAQQVL
jgi:ATP-dependent DNA helicase RecQ